ncbi:MAG TPA: ABC transporter substrate-binding protein, partial [Marinobacter sp.]|nr:ABC transporter substrate-binding protein [Marinobacter sp.]
MTINENKEERCGAQAKPGRRSFFRKVAVGAALTGALILGAGQVQAATTWKLQSVWDAGTVGYDLFEAWCESIEEKSGGEL